MPDDWEIELEPEVRDWLDTLPYRHYSAVERHADRRRIYHRTFEELP